VTGHLTVEPGPAEATVPAPRSKSVTHRALFAALVAGGGTVATPLWSEDTRASLRAVLGFGVDAVATDREAVLRGGRLTPTEVDAANSGTTLRFAAAVAALAEGSTTLTGDASLAQRPVGPLVDALEQLGADADCEDGTPPVTVTGPATGGKASLPGDVSSQFVSALLLAAPRLPEGLALEVDGPLVSRPYVDLTLDTLDALGVPVAEQAHGDDVVFHVEPTDLRPAHLAVPGDYSGAAFPLVAGALAGGPVTVTGLEPGSRQGDAAVLDHLERFDAEVRRDGEAVTARADGLEATRIDLADTPDLFPPLSALAARAEGTTVLENAPHLRDKETDRIAAMVDGLQRLGVDATAREDGAEITGGPVEGGTVDGRGDHRVQMAFAVLGLAAEGPVAVEGAPRAFEVSYPGFLDALRDLEAEVQLEEGSA
jgi:3-phosphoshikimate 1-carboxyvinyltransferase